MDNKIKVAKLLQQLCLIMNQQRSEEQLAGMSAYLCKHFTFEQISIASERILQRSTFFPSISDFFNILNPIQTLEQRALLAFEALKIKIKENGFSYTGCKGSLTQSDMEFIDIVGFNNVWEVHPKEAKLIMEAVLNKPITGEVKRVEG